MRYLYVTTHPPSRCGIAAYASQSIARLRENGDVVDVMSPNREGDVDFKSDLRGSFKLLELLKLALFYDRLVIQYHPDFFFKSRAETGSTAANLAAALSFILIFLLHRRKIEIVCHEIYDCSIATVGPVTCIAQRAMWLLAPRMVFHTPRELEAFAVRFRFGVRGKNLDLRAHGRDFRKFEELSPLDARRKLAVNHDGPVFLCIGFIQPHKGFDRAIAAFNAVNPPNARLYIVGSLRLRYHDTVAHLNDLRTIAARNPNVVIVERFVSDAEFDTWIAACDYVVVPYREIWSSSVVARAKLFNRSVLAAAVGGLGDQLGAHDHIFSTDGELETLMAKLTRNTGPHFEPLDYSRQTMTVKPSPS